MKSILFGGSFNPVHIGHVFMVETLVVEYGFEQVFIVPARVPPHKDLASGASSPDRLAMLREGMGRFSQVVIEEYELRRHAVSYTINTVRHVEQAYDITGQLSLLIGDDLVSGVGEWKDAAELAARTLLVIFHRNYSGEMDCAFEHTYVDNKIMPVSSNEIRERVRSSKAFKTLCPEAVSNYIEENGLYR